MTIEIIFGHKMDFFNEKKQFLEPFLIIFRFKKYLMKQLDLLLH